MIRGKLHALLDDVRFSMDFANVHLRHSMSGLMRTHGARHQRDIDAIRQTDTDASALARFRESIRNNSTPDNRTGTEDYKQMVDLLIRRSGIIKPYAGPQSFKDWAQLKDVKAQLRAIKHGETDGERMMAREAFRENLGMKGLKSVASLAFKTAVAEVAATIGDEVTPEIQQAILEGIVAQCNEVNIEYGDATITVDDIKGYLADLGDGMTQPTDLSL